MSHELIKFLETNNFCLQDDGKYILVNKNKNKLLITYEEDTLKTFYLCNEICTFIHEINDLYTLKLFLLIFNN